MNTPNPLVPQGTFPDKGKSHIRMTVFAILAIHVVLLGVLLIAGCNKKTEQALDTTGAPPVPPPAGEPWPAPPTSPPPPQATQAVSALAPPTPVPDATVAPPPAPTDQASAAVATGFTEHTIAKGDSFYTVGKKYNVGCKAIADANPGVNPNRLKIGDKIKIPPPRTSGPSTLIANARELTPPNGAATSYKVKSGDNLMKIASTYGVTVKQLRSANNLKTDQIKVGQTLKIPAKSVPAQAEAVPPAPAVPPVQPPPIIPPPTNP